MKSLPVAFLSPIRRSIKVPIHRQLYEGFRGAIREGQIRPGQRVPSSRALSKELKVSRIPVLSAYEQLVAEGYFESLVGAGTYVSRSIPDDVARLSRTKLPHSGQNRQQRCGPRRTSHRSAALRYEAVQPWLAHSGAFRVSQPALDQFPHHIWSKLLARLSRWPAAKLMAYGDAAGYPPLRETIADYVRAARGVGCDPLQILVTSGSQQALQLAAQVLLDPGDTVCVEEPGYPGARQAFLSVGARLNPVQVDQHGLAVEELFAGRPTPRALYVTPSHQYPLGVTMSAARRLRLLDWASRLGVWVIEDDYDSEYRFGARPIMSLQGLDDDARVIYIGTFSKVMFPALRLGYLVVPKDLMPALLAARDAADVFSSTLSQAVLTNFIREGHFARHVRRMRVLYAERRDALLTAIRDETGGLLEVVGAEAGVHLAALLPPQIEDVALAIKAAECGVSAMPLSSCCLNSPKRHGLILGYGGASPQQIREGVRKLKVCLSMEVDEHPCRRHQNSGTAGMPALAQ
jgi:GntR family transcriptional regulator / MocR family aminotransferase